MTSQADGSSGPPPDRNTGHDLALVISDLGSGGAQRVVMMLTEAWLARGRRLCLITLAPSDADFFVPDRRITRIVIGGLGRRALPLAGLVANLRRILALRRALRRSGAPTVISFVGTTNILTIAAAAGLGLKVVISERNDPARQSLGSPAWDRLRRLCYRFADVTTANSHGAMATLASFVPKRRLAYVPNPVPRPPQVVPAGDDHPTVLSVGRLTRQKAHDVLLAAFAAVAAKHPAWRLHIAGTGELGDGLRAQAESLGLAERVSWLGAVADPYPYYYGAELFCLPSRFEGTPNAVLEAMSCGLPVVVSDRSGGAQDVVVDGESGLVVPADDSRALAAALDRLMGDAALRRRLGDNARARLAPHAPTAALAAWDDVLASGGSDRGLRRGQS